jgi:hypothetical protein
MIGMWTRLLAGASGLAVAIGAVAMLLTLVAAPGQWTQGYVSEAGTTGRPFALAYRSGLILLALGVALLGTAFALQHRRRRETPAGSALQMSRSVPIRRAVLDGRPAFVRLAAVLLGAASLLAGTAGAVPCSNQCPLPPFEPTTLADVVHTVASILGIAILAGAMIAVALTDLRRAVRGLALAAAAVTLPLGAAMGLTMLLVGRGALGWALERVLLVVAVSWLVGTAHLMCLPERSPRCRR